MAQGTGSFLILANSAIAVPQRPGGIMWHNTRTHPLPFFPFVKEAGPKIAMSWLKVF
ncbi:MAG: hypothetical protein ABIQ88_07410 [Chitinophagaceae bacterium]